MLGCIAGLLEKPDPDEIMLREHEVSSEKGKKTVPPEDRELGVVFQSYTIWPHIIVYENVALPLTLGRRKICQKSEGKSKPSTTQFNMDGLVRWIYPILMICPPHYPGSDTSLRFNSLP